MCLLYAKHAYVIGSEYFEIPYVNMLVFLTYFSFWYIIYHKITWLIVTQKLLAKLLEAW
jgi:hypothetical protein